MDGAWNHGLAAPVSSAFHEANLGRWRAGTQGRTQARANGPGFLEFFFMFFESLLDNRVANGYKAHKRKESSKEHRGTARVVLIGRPEAKQQLELNGSERDV
jgi:hypothetical protein